MAKLAHALAAAAGNAAGSGIEYIASNTNTTTSNTLALPSGTQVGDLVISFTGTISNQYTPSGWTTAFFYNGTFEINCLYKVMGASDISAGTVQLALTGNIDWTAMQLHTFRPSSAITSTYSGGSVADRSVAGTSITVNPNLSLLGPPHIILGGNLFYNVGAPNMSGAFWQGKINSTGGNGFIRIQFAYEIQNDYSTSRTFSQTGTGNAAYDLMGGCYLSLAL
jgi:hypothetical protein